MLAAAATPARADHPIVGFGTEVGGPVNTIPASTLPRGGWAAGVRAELLEPDRFADSELAGFAEAGEEGVHSLDRLTSVSLGIAYGITDELMVSLRIPFAWRENIRESELEDGEG